LEGGIWGRPELIARSSPSATDQHVAWSHPSPQIAEKLSAQGFVAVGGTASDFADLIARDLAKWRRVVNEAGITPE